MPIYEYYSPDTHKIYSFYARRIQPSEIVPFCPDGKGNRMEKLLSRFSFTGRAQESPTTAGCDDLGMNSQQEAAMMGLANEMESFGDQEPDPRALGRMMRKMMEISGQKAPGEMEEMMRRLECGEDPETLEEEFAPLLDNMDAGAEEGNLFDTQAKVRNSKRSLPPARDPVLYEFADHLATE